MARHFGEAESPLSLSAFAARQTGSAERFFLLHGSHNHGCPLRLRTRVSVNASPGGIASQSPSVGPQPAHVC